MGMEEYEEMIDGKTIEDFIQKVKTLPVYSNYEKAVRDKKLDNYGTKELLKMGTLLFAMGNKEFSIFTNSVAMDLLFTMTDQILKNEILMETPEIVNEEVKTYIAKKRLNANLSLHPWEN